MTRRALRMLARVFSIFPVHLCRRRRSKVVGQAVSACLCGRLFSRSLLRPGVPSVPLRGCYRTAIVTGGLIGLV
jgi:hypothetical protein